MQAHKHNFTEKGIQNLPANPKDAKAAFMEYSDAQVVGLRVMVGKTGRKFFYFRYTINKRKRVIAIGEFPALTLKDARGKALQYRAMVANGDDPLAEREKRVSVPTFKEFAEADYIPYAKEHKRSFQADINKLENYLVPEFGAMLVNTINSRDIQNYLNRVKARSSGVNANRYLSLLGRMFNLAIRWGTFEGKNPCAAIDKFREGQGRTRFLSPEEIGKFIKALDQCERKDCVQALKLLLFTGMRSAEVFGLEWKNVEPDFSAVYLPMTKNGRSRHVQVNDMAKGVLQALRQQAAPDARHVFPGNVEGERLKSVRKTFQKACRLAGLADFRTHDLRHTFASWAVNNGVPLYEVKALLGHSDISVTQRYSHHQDATLAKASAKVADSMATAIGQ